MTDQSFPEFGTLAELEEAAMTYDEFISAGLAMCAVYGVNRAELVGSRDTLTKIVRALVPQAGDYEDYETGHSEVNILRRALRYEIAGHTVWRLYPAQAAEVLEKYHDIR